jgi:hypothetical protein
MILTDIMAMRTKFQLEVPVFCAKKEDLYPIIQTYLGESYAGKVTGMLIDQSDADVIKMFKDKAFFNQIIN